MWKRLRHPNIIPFIGVTRNPMQFVSEWMPNGTLTEYLNGHLGASRIGLVSSSSVTAATLITSFLKLLDVAEGLTYLHTTHTIHGDLKGASAYLTKFEQH